MRFRIEHPILFVSLAFMSLLTNNFIFPSMAIASEEEKDNQTFVGGLTDILRPKPTPPTQGESFCFVMPRYSGPQQENRRTYNSKPLFMWQGAVSKVFVEQDGEVIWESDPLEFTGKDNEIQSLQYSGEQPLEAGFYRLNMVLQDGNIEPQDFQIDDEFLSWQDEFDSVILSTDPELLVETLTELREQDRLWEANEVANLSLTLMGQDLLNDLNQSRQEMCNSENASKN